MAHLYDTQISAIPLSKRGRTVYSFGTSKLVRTPTKNLMTLEGKRTRYYAWDYYVDYFGPNGCWIWTGPSNEGGYGLFNFRGKTLSAHRVSFEMFNEDLIDGLEIDHLCYNTKCVNPDHLDQVTGEVNRERAIARRQQMAHRRIDPQVRSSSDDGGFGPLGKDRLSVSRVYV